MEATNMTQADLMPSTAPFTKPKSKAPTESASSPTRAATRVPKSTARRRPTTSRRPSERVPTPGDDPNDSDPEPEPRRSKGSARSPSPSIGRRFFSYEDLVERGIRFSRAHLRRLEDGGEFPFHVLIGKGSHTGTSIAWLVDEVLAWEDSKIAARDAAPGRRQAINA
jgi:hypothetical protein